jgi:hypothetical protein
VSETWEWATRADRTVNVVKRGSEELAREAVASCDETLHLYRRRTGGEWQKVPSVGRTYGRVAYEAYAASTGWKSAISGEPLPAWDVQAVHIRAAWEDAGSEVLRVERAGYNGLARQCADLRDALDEERARHCQHQDEAADASMHRSILGVVAEEAAKVATALGRMRDRWSEGIDARVRINGVTYVLLVGGKDERGAMVKLAEFREWHRV